MRRLRIATLVTAALVAGCSDATAPRPLVADIQMVSFTSTAERDAWPATPTVEGGTTIRVRGTATFGCAIPTVKAEQRGKRIDVAIETADTPVYCTADLVATSPAFEATVRGMDDGEYLVHVTVTGYAGSADWVVTVLNQAVPLASR